MDYDVIIAGAGPAGASAAYWLGAAGYEVAVFEKENLPRHKPCGGGVPRAVFDRFPFDFSPVVERWIRSVRFRFQDGREVAADLPDRSVAMVMRDRFDLHILNHARAEVHDGTRLTELQQDESGVTVTITSGETLRSHYLVGADGANSHVSRLTGLRRDTRSGVAIEAEVPVDDGLLQEYADTALFVFGTPPNGYLWVFPKSDHLSVGVGIVLGGVSCPGIRGVLEHQMRRLGIPTDGVRKEGHPLPIHLRRERLHQGRVLLVGDAAGLVDPLLGEGIRYAVDSGKLATEAVLMDCPASYTRQIHRTIGNDLLWGLRWAKVFYGLPQVSFRYGVQNRHVLLDFVKHLAADLSYRRMATHIPWYVVELARMFASRLLR